MSKVKIRFAGGAGTATGSNFILEVGKLKIMVDCGMFQGEKVGEDSNREEFTYDPREIDILFVTHGHLDHVGRIPKLVKDGFRGVIVSTPATRDIGELVLRDSVGILMKEAIREGLPSIYEEENVTQALALWKVKNYREAMTLNSGDKSLGDIGVEFYNSGHILGSSLVVFDILDERIMFTGDLGNSPSPLLKDTENVKGVTYLITESVYGDRNHEHETDRVEILKATIEKTIVKRGVLLIPAFSVERTQELMFIFNNMVESKEIPLVPVFLDSPLGINITKIYKKYERNFNENVEKVIKSGDNIFAFAGLTISRTTEDSKAISHVPSPKIILAGSGMSNGGRIVHHEARYLGDSHNTLLLVGYQAARTLGRKIQSGLKEVFILGQKIKIRAEIVNISGFSAHKDSEHIQAWIGEMRNTLKKVFVVLGEPKSQNYLAQRLIEKYNIRAEVPSLDESIEIQI